jgi:large subunit ribosomal protein L22
MTFLYKFNKNGTTAEGYVQADSEADAQAKVDAKFPEGSKTKVLGIEQVYVATTRNTRMSAFKGRPIASACQGLKASDALKVVEFSPKKAAEIIKKTILSAIANAENNHGAKGAADLTVKLCVLEESVRMRRYWPTARGSAHPIARRLCHCRVVLAESKKSKKGAK